MTTTKPNDYTQRIVNAVHALPAPERRRLFPHHERAYRVAEFVSTGLVRLDGLTDDGAAALDALAAAVKVERVPTAEPVEPKKK